MMFLILRAFIASLILSLAACASYPPQKPASDYRTDLSRQAHPAAWPR